MSDAQHWDERYAAAELLWSATPNQFLAPEVAGLKPGRALDVACGEGRNAIWLAEQGWQTTGVDFSRVALDKARRLASSRGVEVIFQHGDVSTFEPPARSFDLVIVLYLHLPANERAHALRASADAVAEGGTLLVVAHDATNIAEGYGGPQDPSVLCDEREVVALIPDLVVDRAEKVTRPVATDDGERRAIDLLVRAHRA